MAVLVRCFYPPSRPKPGELFRRSRTNRKEFSGEIRPSEEMVLLPVTKENMAVFFTKISRRVRGSYERGQIFSSSGSKFSKADVLQMARLGETLQIEGKLLGFCHTIMECVSDHQRLASSSFPKAFVLANALMLILPFQVLAETCEADNSVSNMPLLFAIALIGATVGGLLARQRRAELSRLNEQLRQINAALRRQAKIESYAPNLSYAPVGRMPETEVIVDPRKEQLITNLRTGKIFLRNQDPEKAFVEFKAAFEIAQSLGDHVEEKKSARGLGASLQRQGKYREAIKYHSKVLDISKKVGEDSGTTEAYGAIADCYTELGDLEQAGKFYDKYIARLETE